MALNVPKEDRKIFLTLVKEIERRKAKGITSICELYKSTKIQFLKIASLLQLMIDSKALEIQDFNSTHIKEELEKIQKYKKEGLTPKEIREAIQYDFEDGGEYEVNCDRVRMAYDNGTLDDKMLVCLTLLMGKNNLARILSNNIASLKFTDSIYELRKNAKDLRKAS